MEYAAKFGSNSAQGAQQDVDIRLDLPEQVGPDSCPKFLNRNYANPPALCILGRLHILTSARAFWFGLA